MALVCKRCGTKVSKNDVSEGYSAYCPSHDEDLYSFETTEQWEQTYPVTLPTK